ncbi:MAG: GGDEF domain-containing protein [Wenzhouxiangellaceae bacterium]|nr:GGDEF domain-containing protein [Wenzhouxiangellaceae bacterium]
MNSPRLLLDSAADQLPSPNGVALAIMELWEDERTTVKQLGRLVQTDPALSGRLLKLANSAALGAGRSVVSVPEAIVRVGMQTVGQLAVAFSLIDQTSDGHCKTFDYQRFWSQSLLMAILGRHIAAGTRLTAADDLFASCLLSRVGLLAFATVYPEEYASVITDTRGTLSERERSAFGFDHNALSYELMLDYGVPNALAEPARFHETPGLSSFTSGSRPARLVDAFHLAWRLSELGMEGAQAESNSESESNSKGNRAVQARPLAGRLGLSLEQLTQAFDQSIVDWCEWSKLLELPSHSVPAFESLGNDETRAADAQAPRAVVVGNDGATRALFEALERNRFDVRQIAEGTSLARLTVEFQPGLIVLGADCTTTECERLCKMIRGIEWGRSLYLMALRPACESDPDAGSKTALYRAGIDTTLPADADEDALHARLNTVRRHLELLASWRHDRAELRRIANELAISHRKFEVLSLTDQLTELPNRRAGLQALEQAWNRNRRNGTPLGVVMMDIDHFKQINDQHGHAAGDQALIAFARLLRETVRQDEIVCRLGGEEFLLISAAAEIRELIVLGERLRHAVEALRIPFQGQTLTLTASFGLAQRDRSDPEMDALLVAADRAMYQAKARGRNRVVSRIGKEFKTVTPIQSTDPRTTD